MLITHNAEEDQPSPDAAWKTHTHLRDIARKIKLFVLVSRRANTLLIHSEDEFSQKKERSVSRDLTPANVPVLNFYMQ